MDMKDGKDIYHEREIFMLDNFLQFISRKTRLPNVAREEILLVMLVGEILFDGI